MARPAPLREVVHDAILEMIIDRTLRPGQHLAEGELAAELGVSRQPVREALQRLQTEGWIDLEPAQGAFVHTPTEQETVQLLSVRVLLETHAAELAAAPPSEADTARLWELQRAGEAAVAADDRGAMVKANAELHAFITELSGNAVLQELIGIVNRRVQWLYTSVARQRSKDAWAEHAELIEAITGGKPDRARELMHAHITRTAEAIRTGPDTAH
nr:GntR family transcriptional regulator [Sciscionella sp. SE31]